MEGMVGSEGIVVGKEGSVVAGSGGRVNLGAVGRLGSVGFGRVGICDVGFGRVGNGGSAVGKLGIVGSVVGSGGSPFGIGIDGIEVCHYFGSPYYLSIQILVELKQNHL